MTTSADDALRSAKPSEGAARVARLAVHDGSAITAHSDQRPNVEARLQISSIALEQNDRGGYAICCRQELLGVTLRQISRDFEEQRSLGVGAHRRHIGSMDSSC